MKLGRRRILKLAANWSLILDLHVLELAYLFYCLCGCFFKIKWINLFKLPIFSFQFTILLTILINDLKLLKQHIFMLVLPIPTYHTIPFSDYGSFNQNQADIPLFTRIKHIKINLTRKHTHMYAFRREKYHFSRIQCCLCNISCLFFFSFSSSAWFVFLGLILRN